MEAPWVLLNYQLDKTGVSGAYLYIKARQPGLFYHLLELMRLEPVAEIIVSKSTITFSRASFKGKIQTTTPLSQIARFDGGYSKPISLLFMGASLLLLGWICDLFVPGGYFTIWGAFFAGGFVVLYALSKELYLGYETSGGSIESLTFKRGILANVTVDIMQIEETLALLSRLLGSVTTGEKLIENQDITLFGNQATIQEGVESNFVGMSNLEINNLIQPPQNTDISSHSNSPDTIESADKILADII